MPDVTDLLTPEETATQLRLAKQTLARWRCEGRGPAFLRLGARVLYRRADVEAWLSGKRYHSTSDRVMVSEGSLPSIRGGQRGLASPRSARSVLANPEPGAVR